MEHPKWFAWEDSFIFLIAEEDIRSNIVISVVFDAFKGGGVDDIDDILRDHLGGLLVVLDLVLLVESQSVESAEIGSHQLATQEGAFEFGEILLEELNLDGLLDFG